MNPTTIIHEERNQKYKKKDEADLIAQIGLERETKERNRLTERYVLGEESL